MNAKNNLWEQLESTKAYLANHIKVAPKLGLTLGSGLGSFVDNIDVEVRIPYSEIPHFSPPTVDGHSGSLVIGRINNVAIAILQGRIHYYEGHSMADVVYPTRSLAHFGVKQLILTNAAGGLLDSMRPGHFMLIDNHINLTGDNPLRGPNLNQLGPRFPDMSEPYDRQLSDQLRQCLVEEELQTHTGIYCGVSGPCYETAAEIQYFKQIGGGAVGMSTVPETIAAKHMGLQVCGVSCITNLGTGLSDQQITHAEVKDVASKVENQFAKALMNFIGKL